MSEFSIKDHQVTLFADAGLVLREDVMALPRTTIQGIRIFATTGLGVKKTKSEWTSTVVVQYVHVPLTIFFPIFLELGNIQNFCYYDFYYHLMQRLWRALTHEAVKVSRGMREIVVVAALAVMVGKVFLILMQAVKRTAYIDNSSFGQPNGCFGCMC